MTAAPTTEGINVEDRHSLPTRLVMAPIKGYQVVRADRPSPCRHVPSCSTYTIEAIEVHGPIRGLWLGLRRLARCHPWGTSGYDPVPGTSEREMKEN